jgi:hypothetical protein
MWPSILSLCLHFQTAGGKTEGHGKQKEWKRYETLPQAPSVEVVIAF